MIREIWLFTITMLMIINKTISSCCGMNVMAAAGLQMLRCTIPTGGVSMNPIVRAGILRITGCSLLLPMAKRSQKVIW